MTEIPPRLIRGLHEACLVAVVAFIGRCFFQGTIQVGERKEGCDTNDRAHSAFPSFTHLIPRVHIDVSPPAAMSQEQLRFRVPDVAFRVLIVGRENAGKTSILKRVCETTESPKIYRVRNGRHAEHGSQREMTDLHPHEQVLP
ncbi:hypothetical protein OG21DRAFT_1513315 [Imleria badia]|nr:hypothetical protein OG21DRAFT_1513315 [Imleria badia]